MVKEDKAAALRSRFRKSLIRQLPPGSSEAEKLSEVLSGIEEFCDSIAREDNPANRAAMMAITETMFFSAGEDAGENSERLQSVAAEVGQFIRDRVELVRTEKERASLGTTLKNSPKPATSPAPPPTSQADQSLADLQDRTVEKIMAVLRPESCQEREGIYLLLNDLERTCEAILQPQSSRHRDVLLRVVQAGLISTVPFGPPFRPFVEILVSYMEERVTLQMQSVWPFSSDAPRITLRSLIIPGDKTTAGTLVTGVTALWFEILQRIKSDPNSIYQIDCWKWEELLAGAYQQDGWEIVTLTPKRGDHGIDVIAERHGWGQLRFLLLDQMKAYKPGHLIGPDEIREMKGVLLEHPEASKAMVTTTAEFTPGALDAAKNLAPRLELRSRDKLLAWLASVAVGKQETQ